MKAFYETGSGPAGQPRQWARDRTLYVPDVRFAIFMDENGKPVARQYSYQEFADLADPLEVNNGFYEHEIACILLAPAATSAVAAIMPVPAGTVGSRQRQRDQS